MDHKHLSTDYSLSSMNIIVGKGAISNTGELGYDRLNGTREIGPSYAKSVVYIWRILDMHLTGTKHIVHHMQKSVVQWSVISKFTCINYYNFYWYSIFGVSKYITRSTVTISHEKRTYCAFSCADGGPACWLRSPLPCCWPASSVSSLLTLFILNAFFCWLDVVTG